MANAVFNKFKAELLAGNIDLDAGTWKVLLVTSAYTPDIDAHDFRDDVTNEVTGTGYTAGGATLANLAVTQDNTNDRGKFDADDVTWSAATITARGAVIYKSTGNAATDLLVGYLDFGSDKTSTAGDFLLSFSADGVLYVG